MTRAAYAAVAFLIWLVAAIVYLDVQGDMVELRLMERDTITHNAKGK